MCLFFAANNEKNSPDAFKLSLWCTYSVKLLYTAADYFMLEYIHTFKHQLARQQARARAHTYRNPIFFAQIQHAITHLFHLCRNVNRSITPYLVRQKKKYTHTSITPNIVIVCHLASILAHACASVCVCVCVCGRARACVWKVVFGKLHEH